MLQLVGTNWLTKWLTIQSRSGMTVKCFPLHYALEHIPGSIIAKEKETFSWYAGEEPSAGPDDVSVRTSQVKEANAMAMKKLVDISNAVYM